MEIGVLCNGYFLYRNYFEIPVQQKQAYKDVHLKCNHNVQLLVRELLESWLWTYGRNKSNQVHNFSYEWIYVKMRCNEVQLNHVNWTVWHDLFTYVQNYFQCWTFQYFFSYWSKIDFFSGHSKLFFMYISIQLKIPMILGRFW